MIYARLIQMTVVVLGMGLATASTMTYAFKPTPPKPVVQQPKPAVKQHEAARPLPLVHWVHLTSDIRGETWANLDDGRQFHKDGAEVSLLETMAHNLFTYKGGGSIVKTKARYYTDVTDKAGRHMPPSAQELAGWINLDLTRIAPDEERKTSPAFWDYEFETVEGRHLYRMDLYVRDALGEAKLDNQLWYDRDTQRPIRARHRLQVAYQHQYKRDFETIVYDYPETGPADLAALGVPRDTPIFDPENNGGSAKWADLPPGLQDALKAQAEAIRRFPRDYRAVTCEDSMIHLEYWSAPQEAVDARSETMTGDRQLSTTDQPRHFSADNQDSRNWPEDLAQALADPGKDDLPVDRIVAWLPFERSVNIGLKDGKRTYDLTRFIAEAKQPRRTQLHVLGDRYFEFPRLVNDQWPVVGCNRRYLTLAQAEPDTPAGMVVIKFHQIEPSEFRTLYTLDPAHDFIAVRQLEWSKSGDRWHKTDKRALRFKLLPGGSWYVSAWEEETVFDAKPDRPADKNEANVEIQRVEITPLKPDEFPKDIFNGEKLLESARKEGATIEVDQ